jgi:hypothetical protein
MAAAARSGCSTAATERIRIEIAAVMLFIVDAMYCIDEELRKVYVDGEGCLTCAVGEENSISIIERLTRSTLLIGWSQQNYESRKQNY